MEMTDPRWLKEAKEVLPCVCSDGSAIGSDHDIDCPATYRPAVAALAQRAFEAGVDSVDANNPGEGMGGV